MTLQFLEETATMYKVYWKGETWFYSALSSYDLSLQPNDSGNEKQKANDGEIDASPMMYVSVPAVIIHPVVPTGFVIFFSFLGGRSPPPGTQKETIPHSRGLFPNPQTGCSLIFLYVED